MLGCLAFKRELFAPKSYFLCISGYFPSIATWLSGAVSWLGAGNNPLPKNNSARRKRTTSHLFLHVLGCLAF
jgi:hypothetical protein